MKADGTCVIDIFPKAGAVSDTSTYYQISSAAEKVYGSCVARGGGQRPQGGWIRDLGRRYILFLLVDFMVPLCDGSWAADTSYGSPLPASCISETLSR